MLEVLGKEDDDAVRERMAIVDFHVSLHLESIGELSQSDFKFYLIPENHWRHFVIVFGCLHDLVSRRMLCSLYFLFNLADMLRLHDLLQLFLPLLSQFLDINECFSLFLNLLEEILLLLHRFFSQPLLEVLDRVLVNVKSVSQWSPFGPINESFSLSCYLLFICDDSQVDIYIISSQSRDRRSVTVISVARASFLLRAFGRQEVVSTLEPVVTLHSILKLKLNF